ncbi:MAG: type II secretion system protein [Gammaproteobacteria bacterium]|nr:type II secretion system protein [Gammaproteobacteria bacterium]
MTGGVHRFAARGMTLIELIVSIVVISVGLAGILVVMDHNTRASADPIVQQQAVAVAEAYLEEILLKEYDEFAASGVAEGAPGPDAGEANRVQYDDVNDYDGLANNGCINTTAACPTLTSCACDQNGDPVASLTGYTVTVAVDTAASLNGDAASRVQVNVIGPGGLSLSLSGYRTNY